MLLSLESLGQLFRGAEKLFSRAVVWGEQRSVCTFGPSYRADQNGVGYSQKKEQLDFLFLPHKCTPEVRVAEKRQDFVSKVLLQVKGLSGNPNVDRTGQENKVRVSLT